MDIRIIINDNNVFRYDKNNFLQSAVYFITEKTKHLDMNKIKIRVMVDGEPGEQIGMCGKLCFVENTIEIILSTFYIRRYISNNTTFRNEVILLLHCFLHEVYHLIDFLEEYSKINLNSIISIKQFWKIHLEYHKTITKIFKRSKRIKKPEDYYDYLPWEQYAELFAFNNFNYMEHLYKYPGVFTIPTNSF